MKITLALFAASALCRVHAQVTTNGTTAFQCLGAAAGKEFCAAASLTSNIIIRCSGTVGQPGNCNDNLAGVPPVGVKDFAPCYQSSPTAGDAACSYNGIAYPDTGAAFNISSGPSPPSSLSSSSSSSTSSPTASSPTSTAPTTTASPGSSSPTSSFSTALVTPYVPIGTGAVPVATTTAAVSSTSSSVATQGSTVAAFTGRAGKVESEWLIAELGMVAATFWGFF